MNTVTAIKALADAGEMTEVVRTELKKLGPPRPELALPFKRHVQRLYVEKFNTELYDLAHWLCGCSVRNALFCYICLVMTDEGDKSAGKTSYWVSFGLTTGITSKNELMKIVNKHEVTPEHMHHSLNYALLGENNVLHHLRNEFFLGVTQHNEKVRPNRYILSKLIDCVKYTSGVSDYKAEMTQVLNDSGGLVSGVFLVSFQDILDSIHAVCVDLIVKEIEQTDFVSLEIDEVNTVGSPVKLVFIFRYELKGEIRERFLKYTVPQSNHSVYVSSIILKELDILSAITKKPENMISFSYDGLIPVFANRWGLHTKIKDRYKKMHFVHSYAHNIDFVMEQTGSLYKDLRIFFINLKSFGAFFSSSEKYISILDTVVAKQLDAEFKTEWTFPATSPTVLTLRSHKSDIDECLDQIIDEELKRSTVAEAVALKNLLRDEDFNYWLEFFSKVMPVCDELFYQMQQLKAFDAVQVRAIVETFKTEMNRVKSTIGHGEANPPPKKRPCIEEVFIKEEVSDGQIVTTEEPQTPQQDLREFTRTEKANQVFNVIKAYIEERVTPNPFLLLASLVHPGFFASYRHAFPMEEIELATKILSLDKDAVTAELEIIYSRDELAQAEGALFILHYFYEKCLSDVFPEVFKLLKMVCTVPIATSEPGRCFDTLKQIKGLLKSSCDQKESEVLAMCLLEKNLMKSTPNFNELVIEHLCKHSKGGTDYSGFTYKQLY